MQTLLELSHQVFEGGDSSADAGVISNLAAVKGDVQVCADLQHALCLIVYFSSVHLQEPARAPFCEGRHNRGWPEPAGTHKDGLALKICFAEISNRLLCCACGLDLQALCSPQGLARYCRRPEMLGGLGESCGGV